MQKWRQDHRPCKIVKDTLEDPRKNPWKMERHKPKVKVKTYMELSNSRQVHTSCIWRGGATLRWHTDRTRWGNERLFHGRNASFRVCHLIAAPYMYVYILYIYNKNTIEYVQPLQFLICIISESIRVHVVWGPIHQIKRGLQVCLNVGNRSARSAGGGLVPSAGDERKHSFICRAVWRRSWVLKLSLALLANAVFW